MKLFEVKIQLSSESSPWNYETHYVAAIDFDEAKEKAMSYFSLKIDEKSIFDVDGSLNLKARKVFFRGIDLKGEIIF